MGTHPPGVCVFPPNFPRGCPITEALVFPLLPGSFCYPRPMRLREYDGVSGGLVVGFEP